MLFSAGIQIIIGFHFVFPILLRLLSRRGFTKGHKLDNAADYAIIVTYYKQLTLLPGLLDSISRLKYDNFLVYVVADGCPDESVTILNPKVVLLRPGRTLSDNIESHRFAIKNFRRRHNRITIIDGDNLIHHDYLTKLNVLFDEGYCAVQGARYAKNLNNEYANLDGVSDLYFRYVD